MTQDMNAEYVSSPEAARILRITYVGVAQLARQGKIPAVKIANRWLIPKAFVEEFAQTYQGRRGRPRKKAPAAGIPEVLGTAEPGQPVSVDSGASAEVMAAGRGLGESGPVYGPSAYPEETPVPPTIPAESVTVEPVGASEPQLSEPLAVSEPTKTGRPTDDTFSISAEVYHLDRNYDFEVYEKGEITEHARLIVARLKPKIPSLPQFSFRWDYRYEHLNVDIHGVEPTVTEWWTMGENGYTGHLPRRLDGPGFTFEAVIWLPVTFVFRGRLTLSLQDNAPEEESPSVATTTGGLRRLWTRWTGTAHS